MKTTSFFKRTKIFIFQFSILNLLSLAIIFSACGNKNTQYDASGVFEATEVVVSAQANGELMAFNVVEGSVVEANMPLGYIDTTQLYLRKMQLLARDRKSVV